MLANFLSEYDDVVKKLKSIKEESGCVDSKWYYDEHSNYSYYGEDDGDILLKDNEDVIKDINTIILFINKCVDYKEYEKGYKLVKRLCQLK